MGFWNALGGAFGMGGGGASRNAQSMMGQPKPGYAPQQQQEQQGPAGEAPGGIGPRMQGMQNMYGQMGGQQQGGGFAQGHEGPSQQSAGPWDQVMRGNVGTGGYGQQNGMGGQQQATSWASPQRIQEMMQERQQAPWGGGNFRQMIQQMYGGGGMGNINPPPGSTPPWMQQDRPIFGGGWNNGPNDAMRDGPGSMRGQDQMRQSLPIYGPGSITHKEILAKGGHDVYANRQGGGLGPRNFNPGMMRGMGQRMGMGQQMKQRGGQPTDMVPNGWGGQMTRAQAEAMRRSGAVS